LEGRRGAGDVADSPAPKIKLTAIQFFQYTEISMQQIFHIGAMPAGKPEGNQPRATKIARYDP
jgi:hypothetical protein